jgi:hypothetical protein
MNDTIILYFALLSLMTISLYFAVNIADHQKSKILKNILYYTPAIIYSLFWGYRYYVGTDYISYVRIYEAILAGDYFTYNYIEPGFMVLNVIVSIFRAETTGIFVATSAIMIISLYYSQKKYSKILPYIIFFYFTSSVVLFSQNGIRQSMAFLLFVVSVRLYKESNLTNSLIIAILAVSFHKSVILPIAVVLILHKNYFSNRVFTLLILMISISFNELIIPLLYEKSQYFFQLLGYNHFYRLDKFTITNELATGIGFSLKISIYILSIYLSNRVRSFSESSFYQIIYTLFIIGIILEPMVEQNMMLKRINVYFLSMRVFLYAYNCYYLISNRSNTNAMIFIYYILVHIVLFSVSILTNSSGCGEFIFA